jgi:hypothetical protein
MDDGRGNEAVTHAFFEREAKWYVAITGRSMSAFGGKADMPIAVM